MPKSSREQIQQRRVYAVDSRKPAIRTASGPTGAMGNTHSEQVVHVARSGGSFNVWAALSPAFGSIMNTASTIAQRREQERKIAEAEAKAEAKMAQAEAKAEAREAERKREAEAKEAQAELRARQDSLERIAAAAVGNRLISEVDEKTRTGEWGMDEVEKHLRGNLEGEARSSAFSKAYEAYAIRGLGIAEENNRRRIQGEANGSFLSLTRQSFRDLYSAYEPDKHDDYIKARTEIFEARKGLGISGDDINKLELEAVANLSKRYASSDPAKAQALLDLAEQVRPDGSPSLAASIGGGYATLQTLREQIADSIVKESITERAEAKEAFKNTTRENYVTALTEISRLNTPEEINQWTADNVDTLEGEAFRAAYGDYRADLLNAVSSVKSSRKPAGNEEAMAGWMEAIQRGEAEWEDINQDTRLTPTQRPQLFSVMKEATQKAQLGYIPDAQLASKLLADLEADWSDSIYGTPWAASRVTDPGKPPVVTPEGLFYQGELFKQLRTLDPNLDVVEMNQRKMEVAQGIRDGILSGKIRWQDRAGNLGEPAPELKLREKVKEKEPLTEQNIAQVAKVYNAGGNQQVKDVFGIDFFEMPGPDQRRITAEVNRQKAEIEALKADSFLYKLFDMGGEPVVDTEEKQRQMDEEAARLYMEGMELDRKLILGEDVNE